MDKISKIGLAVSIALLVAYYAYNLKRGKIVHPPTEMPKKDKVEAKASVPVPTGPSLSSSPSLNMPSQTQADNLPFSDDASSSKVETDYLSAELSNDGGVIRRIVLKENAANGIRKIKGEASGDVNLLDVDHVLMAPSAIFNTDLNPVIMKTRTDGKSVEFVHEYENKVNLSKKFSFDRHGYYASLSVSIENKSGKDLKFDDEKPLYMVCGTIAPIEKSDDILGVDVCSEGKMIRKSGNVEATPADVEWLGLKTKYFALIFKPDRHASFFEVTGLRKTTNIPSKAILGCARGMPGSEYKYLTAVLGFKIDIKRGEKQTINYVIYCGPADYKLLGQGGHKFEDILNLGIWAPICKVIIWFLDNIYKIIRSFGWAIIILTIVAKIILWPLTHKSYKSMKEMQKIQPMIEPLKQKYKNDPKKLQSETWKLYKQHGINPMGGCLPMVLQFPILFALYSSLRNTILLRKAPFWIIPGIWIKDLSGPDALIKFSSQYPIIGNELNLLPLLMGVSMYFQQKFTPAAGGGSAQSEQQQKMMSVMMPVMLTFIFYTLPSGLNLYFFFSTAMSVAQQIIATRKT